MNNVQHETVSERQLIQQLLDLGVIPSGVLLVHCSFSRVKPIENGPLGLIAALRAALGPDGTLVMPSMSSDDDHPFDPRKTPCHEMGVVANTYWQLPNVLRSDSPRDWIMPRLIIVAEISFSSTGGLRRINSKNVQRSAMRRHGWSARTASLKL